MVTKAHMACPGSRSRLSASIWSRCLRRHRGATTIAGDEAAVDGGTFNVYINEPVCIDPVDLEESEGTQVGQACSTALAKFDCMTERTLAGRGRSVGGECRRHSMDLPPEQEGQVP